AAEHNAITLEQSRRADQDLAPVDTRSDPRAGDIFELVDGQFIVQSALLYFVKHCPRERMAAACLRRGHQTQQLVFRHAVCNDVRDTRLAPPPRPGLSKTIAWMRAASSSDFASLNRTPRCPARSVAARTAVGVASPSASGPAFTTAVTANVN